MNTENNTKEIIDSIVEARMKHIERIHGDLYMTEQVLRTAVAGGITAALQNVTQELQP